jgi:putative flippase GtrA
MRQIAIFAAVGALAALTHLTVVALLVEHARLEPLTANVAGFCIAFFVSFSGHARWTFPTAARQYSAARTKFFAVALTGFIINQTAYAAALRFCGDRYYLPLLAAVLVGVAAATFLLAKLWAFRDRALDA